MRLKFALAVAACIASPAFAQSAPTTGSMPSPEEVASKDSITVAAGAAILNAELMLAEGIFD